MREGRKDEGKEGKKEKRKKVGIKERLKNKGEKG